MKKVHRALWAAPPRWVDAGCLEEVFGSAKILPLRHRPWVIGGKT